MSGVVDDVAAILAASGLMAGSSDWPIWVGQMPDSTALPDRAVAVVQVAGEEPPLPNIDLEQPRVTVLVRGASVVQVSTSYEEADRLAQDIRDHLHFWAGTAPTGVRYAIIQAADEPATLGEDERRRPQMAATFRAWREST